MSLKVHLHYKSFWPQKMNNSTILPFSQRPHGVAWQGWIEEQGNATVFKHHPILKLSRKAQVALPNHNSAFNWAQNILQKPCFSLGLQPCSILSDFKIHIALCSLYTVIKSSKWLTIDQPSISILKLLELALQQQHTMSLFKFAQIFMLSF